MEACLRAGGGLGTLLVARLSPWRPGALHRRQRRGQGLKVIFLGSFWGDFLKGSRLNPTYGSLKRDLFQRV